jgi:hypothetical protein
MQAMNEPIDPASIRSRFEKGFDGQFLKLAKLCITWGIENRIGFLQQSALKMAVECPSFRAICDFHELMKRTTGKSDVPEFLLELVDSGYYEGFLVAYVVLVSGKVPERYSRRSVPGLGRASNLHIRLEMAGVVLGDRKDVVQ